jgi:hypothetical protein
MVTVAPDYEITVLADLPTLLADTTSALQWE